ncbi:hypothetical protein RchiOBHm_Chr6g0252221 [Rosa chinensis]|uniref:Uncharacterized protein n=1 Tax=Rosa chinensis TaxID=74649 RepID=A0A2P6PL04_ROSCH|nr:hypothetical protein RchiOBHm_Chr6g0252221 [Rosa chinensis]
MMLWKGSPPKVRSAAATWQETTFVPARIVCVWIGPLGLDSHMDYLGLLHGLSKRVCCHPH